MVILLATRKPLTPGHAVAGGLLYGVLVLTVPAFLLVLPIFVLFLFASNDLRYRQRATLSIIFVLGLSAVVGSWTTRNWVRFDQLLLVSANGGENLLIGNCDNARPNSGVNSDISQYRAMAEGRGEIGRDRFFREQALSWIRENPREALKLYLLETLNYFNFRNELWTASEESALRQIVVFAGYYPLLIVSLYRLAFLRRIPFAPAEVLMYALYFGNAFANALFFTRLRYRIPFDFVLIAIVAMFLGRVLELRRDRSATVESR